MPTPGVDEESLRRMAARVAEGPEGPEAEKGPGLDPNWPKIHTLHQTKLKSSLKDLEQAIRDEDPKLTSYSFEHVMRNLVEISKALGMKGLTSPLRSTVDKAFR